MKVTKKKLKKHQHLVCPSMQVLLLLDRGISCTNRRTNRGTNGGKNATIKACWKVGTTIVLTTFQSSNAMGIIIAISFPNGTLIRAGTTAPSTRSILTSRSWNYNTGHSWRLENCFITLCGGRVITAIICRWKP